MDEFELYNLINLTNHSLAQSTQTQPELKEMRLVWA